MKSNAPAPFDCPAELGRLYNAYSRLVAGEQTVSVQTSDFRQVQYSAANLEALVTHYNTLWDHCGEASGYPRLRSPKAGGAQRGGPAPFMR